MSWWVSLRDKDGECVSVASHSEGGTYAMGGTTEADLNITYNYGGLYRLVWDGVGLEEKLNKKQASDVTADLEMAVEKLGANQYKRQPDNYRPQQDSSDPFGIKSLVHDYWAPTPGNAGHALSILLAWAKEHPEATFEVH